jgi:hypothetical protein
MSDDSNNNGGETTKAPKKQTEYTTVKMEDGREVKFAGKRKVNRDVEVVKEGETPTEVRVRFDFLNGKSLTLSSADIPTEVSLRLLGHGISQKVGDESAGVASVEDMVLGSEEMIARLKAGDFNAARQAGDSFAGASIVIKAICEATGKSVEDIKLFLNKKLEAAKAAGQSLSRKDLYDSFRNPASKTGAIIERLEREARSKESKVNADDLLAEAGA